MSTLRERLTDLLVTAAVLAQREQDAVRAAIAARKCAWCGRWLGLTENTTGQTSHGICPSCEQGITSEVFG